MKPFSSCGLSDGISNVGPFLARQEHDFDFDSGRRGAGRRDRSVRALLPSIADLPRLHPQSVMIPTTIPSTISAMISAMISATISAMISAMNFSSEIAQAASR
jgi:hypothetical protein